MENYLSPVDLGLILSSFYLLVIFITYLRALKLDKTGIRTKALVRSFETKEFLKEGPDGALEERSRDFAHIAFETKNQQTITAKIPASRYKKEKYRDSLPIIYPKHRPHRAKIDDTLYIYELPLGLTLIGMLILLMVAVYMAFS